MFEDRGEQWTEIVSWEPRAFIYHNFLVSHFLFSIFRSDASTSWQNCCAYVYLVKPES